ncbi:hypothetical protein YPPY11_3047, partial [Yersinia pestis PY-11]
MIETAGGGN